MKVLITGINGLLGQALAQKLTCQYEVTGAGRSLSSKVPGVRYHCCDLSCRERVGRLFDEEQFDWIFHLAGPTTHSDLVERRVDSLAWSWQSTHEILSKLNAIGRPVKLFYASSGKVYAPSPTGLLNEQSPTNPETVLGQHKLHIESLISFHSLNSNLQFVIGRTFNVYGPLQRASFVIPAIIDQLRTSTKIHLGNLDDRRDYLFVDDWVDGAIALMQASLPMPLTVVNVGSGRSVSVRQILKEFESILNTEISVLVDERRLRRGEPSDERASLDVMASFGWIPNIDLRDGLVRCLRERSPELVDKA